MLRNPSCCLCRADTTRFKTRPREHSSRADELCSDSDPSRHAYYELVARLDAAIDQATENPLLVASLENVRTHMARIRRLAQDNPARLKAAAAEHLTIVEAIAEGSESIAAHATEVHLYRSLKSILASGDNKTGDNKKGTIK